jgi:hypothetical protein
VTQPDFGGIEPSADMRTYARTLRQMFVALQLEGFTEQQTLRIIGLAISAVNGGAA